MRRQNPPQFHIDKAVQVEKYLHRPIIGSVYAALGVLYALAVSAIFLGLLQASILKGTPVTIAVFVAIGLVPATMALLGYLMSPRDPISQWLIRVADNWRRPLEVQAELYTFRELLMNAEASCIKIWFYMPARNQTDLVKERLYTYVHAVLHKECSTRTNLPSRQEIQNLIDPAIEILASECDIPVLYSEINEAYELQTAVNLVETPLQLRYWSGMGA